MRIASQQASLPPLHPVSLPHRLRSPSQTSVLTKSQFLYSFLANKALDPLVPVPTLLASCCSLGPWCRLSPLSGILSHLSAGSLPHLLCLYTNATFSRSLHSTTYLKSHPIPSSFPRLPNSPILLYFFFFHSNHHLLTSYSMYILVMPFKNCVTSPTLTHTHMHANTHAHMCTSTLHFHLPA